MRLQLNQVQGLFQAFLGLASVSASGGSTTVTTPIGTAANTAGRGGVSVPVQVGSSSQQGFVTSGQNKVLVFDSATREHFKDASQNRVYGRLTGSSPYTVTYFTFVGSVETAYSFGGATNVDLLLPYIYEFGLLPPDFAARVALNYFGEDLGAIGGGGTTINTFSEIFTVATLNTMPPLTKTPFPASAVTIFVGGIANDSQSGDFTLTGTGNKTPTWVPAVAGHDLVVGTKLRYLYPTQE